MAKTGIVYSEKFLKHETGQSHPENKNRLVAILEKLKGQTYFSEITKLESIPATKEIITTVHSKEYVESLEKITGKSGYLDGDTPYSPGSLEAAYLASGSGIILADKILSKELRNGLALVRPPGHHAEKEHAMGFCIFNNIAITARYLQQKGISRVAILDWDVHHGNGTQNAFYEDDSILFISTHQYPFYPGTGSISETGSGKGKGFNLNIPMPRGAGNSEYLNAFRESIVPAIEKFQPEFILISAGFDAHKRDPLASIELTTSAFEEFSVLLKKAAEDLCGGNLISFLEGGYDLTALSESVETHLSVLKG